MKKNHIVIFIKDERAVSEEFTSLPALCVIMIAFTLFFGLVANVYSSYVERNESIETYQTADFIATKLTNPDCFFIKEGGAVDLPILCSETGKTKLRKVCTEFKASEINFTLRIAWGNNTLDFPEQLPEHIGNRIAVSRNIGVYINDAQTISGKLTIITWSV